MAEVLSAKKHRHLDGYGLLDENMPEEYYGVEGLENINNTVKIFNIIRDFKRWVGDLNYNFNLPSSHKKSLI